MKIRKATLGLCAVLLLCLCIGSACGQEQTGVKIELRNSSYYPPTMTVAPGTTVAWTNYDSVSHSVTSMTGLFDSGALETGESFTYTFTDPGTYAYGCRINQSLQDTRMPGRIIVSDTVAGNMTGTQADTVIEAIEADANLTVFAQALNATNLTANLTASGPYTVFAPNDEAFADLGNETAADLLNDTQNLTPIIRYHIVEGLYTVPQLANLTESGNATLPTLLGTNITVTREGGALMVDNITLGTTEINADNGIVHTIDAVLMPPEETPAPITENETTDTNRTQIEMPTLQNRS
ncbi:fasciclin [Methanoculleus sp. FWC-SCC1]|uniref:Fasciclin n=1 Tax=Methanoculleus frigidifontis TaxID=2584085 RepID=A0ABT8MDZ3_9EURY|nr:fasciclin domain-containing protein [Methanoculleus sp. FWC-SCC1]MDN7026075.1 fasciclin [Methanoculleus sp. FWC-SCC1]